MRVGLFTDAFADRPLGEALDWLEHELPEVHDLEIGVGGYSPAPHRDEIGEITARGYRIAALNASGNPLAHTEHDRALRDALELAGRLGVKRVVCMSGGDARLSGGGWFPGLEKEVEREWDEDVVPYWREVTPLAERAGVRLCFELEPGSATFNTSTFERLAEVSPSVALNLDPSHFFWQGIDPLAVVRRLGARVGWAHGKDTVLDEARVALDGVLDRRAWRYAAVGTKHEAAWWGLLARELAAAGYDEVVSIEVEDELLSSEEAVLRSAGVLAQALAVSADGLSQTH